MAKLLWAGELDGSGPALVRAFEQLALEWCCDRFEIISSRCRAEAHAFDLALGYEEQCEGQAHSPRQL